MQRNDYGVSPDDFIQAWQTSSSVDEVSKKLGMPKTNVHQRASNYRDKGIRLKKMPRKLRSEIDVVRLNEIIDKINKDMDIQPEEPPEKPKRNRPRLSQEELSDFIDRINQ
jgi:hypothetical protein